jgi:hypothetical protein
MAPFAMDNTFALALQCPFAQVGHPTAAQTFPVAQCSWGSIPLRPFLPAPLCRNHDQITPVLSALCLEGEENTVPNRTLFQRATTTKTKEQKKLALKAYNDYINKSDIPFSGSLAHFTVPLTVLLLCKEGGEENSVP